MMNYTDVSKSIAALMEKIGEPLSPLQELALVGSVAVWLEKARFEGQEDILKRLRSLPQPNAPRG